ncbi:uncharacterized protein LOC103312599 [Tribolium castaneum]|uniref:Uncharacterized protein n=1 Tax=Tribolium castaneum TaxID=7070 RepID=D2A320_TRICA|nr:PREDICTED: uncharacterized protein LOC103312599 [Tribolium castaneum]EFA01966.2 hypothetical protein TcasGA2_TC007587 [Tribolium castaneum]|eukprot:XP_008191838.1 PREDICTED: uncharacterized protein LOC103312599 [Tribolium castaneum]
MKVISALFLVFCLNFGHAYYFPICSETSKNEKTCTRYFTFPRFTISTGENIAAESVKQPPQSLRQFLDQTFDTYVGPFVAFYVHHVSPVLNHMGIAMDQVYKLVTENLPEISDEYYIAQYLPFVKVKKAKADSRLYFLFILASLCIYLILYVYFSRKLYFYYQYAIRREYLCNVQKIFKVKE